MTERSERKHVLIAVPSLRGIVTTNIARLFSLSQKLNMVAGHPFRYSTTTAEGISGFALVRNNIAQQFVASDADILWMIDDDIAPEADVFDLLNTDADIVAPLMPMLNYDYNIRDKTLIYKEEFTAFRFRDLNDLATREYVKPELGVGEVDVDAIGTGCIVVKRRVLEDPLMRESGTYLSPDGKLYEPVASDPPPIFHSRMMPNGVCFLSEDIDFTLRAKRLGYTVRLNTSIEVGHKKQLDILPILMIKRHLEGLNISPTLLGA